MFSAYAQHCPALVFYAAAALLAQVLLGVFASNSINILAGVNGLEAGQTFIIACAVLLHNLLQARAERECSNNHSHADCGNAAIWSLLCQCLSAETASTVHVSDMARRNRNRGRPDASRCSSKCPGSSCVQG